MGNEKDKNTLWTKLPLKVDLERCLNRKILFEKFNPEKSKEIEMTDFFYSKLNNCELFIHKGYPKSLFYIKNNNEKMEILMEKNGENKYFYIKYRAFWEIFETKFGLNHSDIQSFTQYLLEDPLNLQGFKTQVPDKLEFGRLEDPLNLQGFKNSFDASIFLFCP